MMTVPYPTVSGVSFKDIPGFPGYCIGDDGSAWSLRASNGAPSDTWRRLKISYAKGYPLVSLYIDGKPYRHTIHRLVLLVFVGPCPEGMEACHYPDPDPTNCRLENLRWDTRKGNFRDRAEHGNTIIGMRQHKAKLTDDDVRELRRLKAHGIRTKDLAAKFGINRSGVRRICVGELWSHIPFDQ